MSQPAEIIAMTWYRREDWERLRALFSDTQRLPASYEDWLARAEAKCRELESGGATVEKVCIDPETFPAWCRKLELQPDAEARARYANDFVTVKYLYGKGQ
ncbi:MAG: hypothetical protein M0017_04270 [Desulfobacteraceae bacterium]|nr:hypothetical protein [Desulfobacteraceae bacterium]